MDNRNEYNLDLKVLKLLDEFENKLENISNIPLTGKIMIDREDFLGIIREINIILPEEYQHVKWIKSQKNQIIEDSQRIADEIVLGAQNEERMILENLKGREDEILMAARETAEEMVLESEIIRIANERAGDILEDAKAMAEDMKTNAFDYAEELLNKLKNDISSIMATVDTNLMEIEDYKKINNSN